MNPNHWYAVGWSKDLQPGQVIPITLWLSSTPSSIYGTGKIAVYRNQLGQVYALEDLCPHRGVALHQGQVKGNHLACRYHGWQLDGQGQCVHIPYLPPTQKLPCAQVRSYPIQEKYGLIWIFPGNPDLANASELPPIPEASEPAWLMVPISVRFGAHFSICNENTMDVFHGVLHENLQGWFNPVLTHLEQTESSVVANYQVSYRGRLAAFLGLSQRANEVTTQSIRIEYCYPHYCTRMENVSSLYLMRLPVGPTESCSYSLFFFKVRLPHWLIRLLQPLLKGVLNRLVLMRFIAQDREMVESEQQTHRLNPGRKFVEINPAIAAVQRLMVRQYEQFLRSLNSSTDPLVDSASDQVERYGHKQEMVPSSKC